MTKNNPASNDKECFVARKKYQKSKRLYRKSGSIIFKEEVRESERKEKSLRTKIRKLRSIDSKNYWKIFCKK